MVALSERVLEDRRWVLMGVVACGGALDHFRNVLDGDALGEAFFFARVSSEGLGEFVLGRSGLDAVERVSAAGGGGRVRAVFVQGVWVADSDLFDV